MPSPGARRDAVIVLMGGSTITMGDWHRNAGAILLAFYPGMEGGTALGEVLSGRVCPGGKLPFSVPAREADLPEIHWLAKRQTYGYCQGYRYLERNGTEPLYAFGFGLSYTSFSVGAPTVRLEDGRLTVEAELANTGNRAGSEVLQLYVSPPEEGEYGVKRLRAFRKVFLKKGERRAVTLSCPLDDLRVYGEETGFSLRPGLYRLWVGTSSREADLQTLTWNNTAGA